MATGIARRILTNFSKGELSPRIDGRPDLAAYFEGAREIENFVLLRQGGLERRYGTRLIHEVKDSTKDTILIPFEASVNDAFTIEFGDFYMRFYKNRAIITIGGVPVEIASPYTVDQIRNVHFTQSIDVLFMWHPSVPQQRVSRLSDTNWAMSAIDFKPNPSFEADTDISGGTATLTPAAVTGTAIVFTASSAVFLPGDVGRVIVYGASRAVITAFGQSAGDTTIPNDQVRADITDNFSSIDPIPAGSWLLKLSPQTTLNPDKKEPEDGLVTLVTAVEAFRTTDVGKFISVYGGLVEITKFNSSTSVSGLIRSVMEGTDDADPAAAPAGAWTLEIASWSPTNGYPRTGEFYQGRLGQAATPIQPTTWWLSSPDDFTKYAVGISADRAIDYTIASRRLNRIEWMLDRGDLFFGTSGAEMRARSGKSDEPFGGDIVPKVDRIANNGSAPIQAQIVSNRAIFVDRSRKKIFTISFNIEIDNDDTDELTAFSEHITGTGIRLGCPAFATRPDPRIYYIRDDGVLLAFTFYPKEKVVGFTRIITDGLFESVAVIPRAGGGSDEVWVIVKRTINGVTKRYVEMFENDHESLVDRTWKSLQTDSAIVYRGTATTTIAGLGHLEGKNVKVIANGGYKGIKTVTGGQITLTESATEVEVGLGYDSKLVTMRPAIEGSMIEGLARSWNKVWVRLLNTIGGYVQGAEVQYSPSEIADGPYTGDKNVTGSGWDDVGRLTIEQKDPYPMTLLAVFGSLSVGGE